MKKENKKELHDIFQKMTENKQEGFNELYEKYHKFIYQIAFSVINHKEKSEDIMQNVFTKILDMKKEKLPTENEMSWLYTVTKNEAVDYIRKQRNTTNIEDIYYITENEDELLHIIDKDKFNRIISRLNKIDQEIVSLKIIGDFSFKEIANFLKMPMGTVQWKYYNALHSLKLIIGNIGMLIVTIGLYITRKSNIPKKHTETIREENQNNSQQEDTEKQEIGNIPGMQTKPNDSTVSTDNKENLKEEQNTMLIDTQLEENTNQMQYIDIGLIILSSIFLISTIIFSIIFIKNQQKRKIKTSK